MLHSRRIKTAETRCIYFPDGLALARVEILKARWPRASLSSLVAQFVAALDQQLTKHPADDRAVSLNMKVYL
jgi:hypothetical protein